ncbi:MAG: hypothetical protein UT43_C0039G0001, partial [Parcubacteria group bacterium GW2011_GWC1_39_29]
DLFDWLGSKNSSANSSDKNWSFDMLYSKLQNNTVQTNSDISQDGSVLAISSQISTQKPKAKTERRTFLVTATGYSSSVDQTDSTPFITASNTFVRDGIIAANFLPIGTRVRIPSLFGDKQFIVEDRMNSRYWYNIDLWFADRASAIHFGKKQVVIEIVS